MRSARIVFSVVCCLLLVGMLANVAHAQYRGSIQGVVTDPQGAVVPGATVTLTDKETNRTWSATSNDSGIYNINALPPSKFSLSVEKDGFKKKIVDNFGIVPEQPNAMNVQLDVGQVAESVTVTGDAVPLLNTESSNLGGSIRAQDFQKLPSFGRDPFQLLQLAPGAFGDGAQGAGGGTQNLPGTTIGGTGGVDGVFKIENGGQITANGARTGDNNYQIDGVGTTSVTWGGTSVITPNEDSIKEVRVVTDNYDAENGRYRGAQVQIISQNGTNQYHGSFFFKGHRPGLNAFQRYNGYANDVQRDDNRFNDWGGSVGGPILKNKIFGYFTYEELSNNAGGQTTSGWYETSALRALAASGTNAAAFYGFKGIETIGGSQTDTLAGQTLNCANIGLAEGENCATIPGQGLDLGRPLNTTLFPRGTLDPAHIDINNPGTGGNGDPLNQAANLDGTADIAFFQGIRTPSNSTHRQYSARVDFNASSTDTFAFSMYYVPNSSTSINGNGARQMNTFNSKYKNRAATAIWDHTFSSSLVNEARVNAAGWMQKDLDQNPNAPWGLPQVSFNGTGSVTVNGYGIGSFNGFDQWTYAAKDVLTKVHGAHTLKMGGEFTRLLSVDAPFWSDRPGYTFNNVWDFLNDAAVAENGQFDPQTGVPSALRKDLRNNIIGLFAQDNWKVKPNLTITAGLRWEYFGPISEKNGKLASVEFGSGANMFSGITVRTGGTQFNAQKLNFGPQLGFNWSPGQIAGHNFQDRFVLRGGFGIAYNGVYQSNTLDVRFNPPFVLNGASFSGNQVKYIDTFPSDVNSPNGYAPNPNAIVTFSPFNLPLTGRTDLTAFPKNEPTTSTYHYTIGGEYDLGHQWVASAGYQGSTTRHLTQHYNLYNPGSVLGLAFNPKVSGVTYYGNDGSARFNAMLLELKHNFSQSFSFDTQYRLSHSMDSGSNAYAGGLYQWDMSTAFATSDYDTRHAFKIYGIWSPTIFHGSNGWMEKIAGGWSISGILNVHSGFPWTPIYNFGDLTGGFDPVFYFSRNGGGSSSNAGTGSILPGKYVGGLNPNYRNNAPVDGTKFFNAPNVVAGTLFDCIFPNPDPVACPSGQQALGPIPSAPGVKRNSFTGPGYFGLDMTLSKSFGLPNMKVIGENGKIEFRMNFYNILNKLNLANVQGNVMDSHFGEAQNGLGGRVIEIQGRFSF